MTEKLIPRLPFSGGLGNVCCFSEPATPDPLDFPYAQRRDLRGNSDRTKTKQILSAKESGQGARGILGARAEGARCFYLQFGRSSQVSLLSSEKATSEVSESGSGCIPQRTGSRYLCTQIHSGPIHSSQKQPKCPPPDTYDKRGVCACNGTPSAADRPQHGGTWRASCRVK